MIQLIQMNSISGFQCTEINPSGLLPFVLAVQTQNRGPQITLNPFQNLSPSNARR